MRNPRARVRANTAFTLVEIMVVVIVIGIVIAAVVPNLGGTASRRRVESAAWQISDLLDYCYNSSLATGRVFAFVVSPDRKAFDIVAERGATEDEQAEGLTGPFYESIKMPGLDVRSFPEGIVLADVRTFDESLLFDEEETIRIFFFPDGTTEFATLLLEDEAAGEIQALELNGMTGALRLFDPRESGDEFEDILPGPMELEVMDGGGSDESMMEE